MDVCVSRDSGFKKKPFPFLFHQSHYSHVSELEMSDTVAVVDQDTSDIDEYEGWEKDDHEGADLKLISSDNFVLWAHSHRLAQVSRVLIRHRIMTDWP
jgi:hypothetical protein